jgi:hypothetical protein
MSTTLGRDDLENIRSAAIHYIASSTNDFRDAFVAELERGALFLDEDHTAIGSWAIRSEGDQIVLVRQPPLSSEMLYYGLYLRKTKQQWRVVGDFNEREQLDFRK